MWPDKRSSSSLSLSVCLSERVPVTQLQDLFVTDKERKDIERQREIKHKLEKVRSAEDPSE